MIKTQNIFKHVNYIPAVIGDNFSVMTGHDETGKTEPPSQLKFMLVMSFYNA